MAPFAMKFGDILVPVTGLRRRPSRPMRVRRAWHWTGAGRRRSARSFSRVASKTSDKTKTLSDREVEVQRRSLGWACCCCLKKLSPDFLRRRFVFRRRNHIHIPLPPLPSATPRPTDFRFCDPSPRPGTNTRTPRAEARTGVWPPFVE